MSVLGFCFCSLFNQSFSKGLARGPGCSLGEVVGAETGGGGCWSRTSRPVAGDGLWPKIWRTILRIWKRGRCGKNCSWPLSQCCTEMYDVENKERDSAFFPAQKEEVQRLKGKKKTKRQMIEECGKWEWCNESRNEDGDGGRLVLYTHFAGGPECSLTRSKQSKAYQSQRQRPKPKPQPQPKQVFRWRVCIVGFHARSLRLRPGLQVVGSSRVQGGTIAQPLQGTPEGGVFVRRHPSSFTHLLVGINRQITDPSSASIHFC